MRLKRAGAIRRPIVPEDLSRLSFIQGGVLSPDGEAAIYSISRTAKDGERERVALRLVNLESLAERPLAASSARDFNPQYSPDGGRVAFLSTRGGSPQIHVVEIKGGKPRRLTCMPQGVGGGPVWSPDGRWLAFTAGPPGAKRDPSRAYRVTRHIHRFDDMGNLDDAVQDIYIISAGGGSPRRMTDGGGHNVNPLWSPDGREILFTANMERDSLSVLLGRLKIVDRKGTVRELIKGWGHAFSAAWLPDGRIVFCGQRRGRPIGSKADVWVVNSKGGAPKCRTAGVTFHVGGGLQADVATTLMALPRLLPAEDGGSVFVQVQEGGAVRICRVALDGPEQCAPVVGGERSCFPLGRRAGRLLFAVRALNNPLDLFIAASDGSSERRITRVNSAAMRSWRLPVVEALEFKGSDGVPVEGWVMKPSAGAKSCPMILYIHGGPHSAFGHVFSFDFHMLAGAGYAVLFLNQRGSTGYGDAFATRIIGDWGNLDYRDLIAGVDAAVER
ncbi:MAG: prolyl oligopeptidase family serine peptidase, partial [Phycisphaerales bacterium]|nr:prolyl oligopeptidase family serine peptidase [Phycisphaerales bacterium]